MIIDLNAETAREQFERSSSDSLEHSPAKIAVETASQEKHSTYPRELTQIPAYIDHLPAKKIKSALSSLMTESFSLMMEKAPRAEGSRSEDRKIIDASFGTMASEFFSKAA